MIRWLASDLFGFPYVELELGPMFGFCVFWNSEIVQFRQPTWLARLSQKISNGNEPYPA